MANCYICETELNKDNSSNEHIILNACGGRLTSNDLLCVKCNSEIGEKIDAILAKQTNDLANLLLIKRHRGEAQSIRAEHVSTGREFYLEYGGKPIAVKPHIEIEDIEKGKKISIKARSRSELKKILTGLKRNYPQLNVEDALGKAKHFREYLDEPLNFDTMIGGSDVLPSIVKIAINFYLLKGGDRKYIKDLIPYLKGESEMKVAISHHPQDAIYIPGDEVSHVLYIEGNPDEGILYAYVELYNVHNFLVLLNQNYDGPKIKTNYIFDVLQSVELNRNVYLEYGKEYILETLKKGDLGSVKSVQKAFQRVLNIAKERQWNKSKDDSIKNAMKNSFEKYPEGTPITEKMLNEFIDELMNDIGPLLR
ncbi:MAG: HNH endonuclease [Ignavibacteria bacterium]|nr:HNH endonuclease [Ignavibacteria bacterium]